MSATAAMIFEKDIEKTPSLIHRLVVSCALLAGSLAIFLFGANYGSLFPTNGNKLYNGMLCVLFLLLAAYFKRNPRSAKYWPIAYAFFIAAAVNLTSSLLAVYTPKFLDLLGVPAYTNQGLGLEKLFSTFLVVIPILGLTWLSGAGPGTLLLKKGNQHSWWGFGIGILVLINFLTSVLIFFGGGYRLAQLGPVLLWGAVFAFSNSMLEELWIRGLFLKKMAALVGPVGAVIVTTVAFAAMHILNIAFLPAAVVPIMVANTFTLGLACAVLAIKTDSIWGAFLIHAAADLFLFVAILAIH